MEWLGWGLFVVILLMYIRSMILNHKKRSDLRRYALYLLLDDGIRNGHKTKLLKFIHDADASNPVDLGVITNNTVENMSTSIVQRALEGKGPNSLPADYRPTDYRMVWGVKEQLVQEYSDATNIVSDFGVVMENVPHTGAYGASERVLPHSKERIRQAIHYLMIHADDKAVNALATGAIYLADYLPEPDGSVAMELSQDFSEALATRDWSKVTLESGASVSSEQQRIEKILETERTNMLNAIVAWKAERDSYLSASNSVTPR